MTVFRSFKKEFQMCIYMQHFSLLIVLQSLSVFIIIITFKLKLDQSPEDEMCDRDKNEQSRFSKIRQTNNFEREIKHHLAVHVHTLQCINPLSPQSFLSFAPQLISRVDSARPT